MIVNKEASQIIDTKKTLVDGKTIQISGNIQPWNLFKYNSINTFWINLWAIFIWNKPDNFCTLYANNESLSI